MSECLIECLCARVILHVIACRLMSCSEVLTHCSADVICCRVIDSVSLVRVIL